MIATGESPRVDDGDVHRRRDRGGSANLAKQCLEHGLLDEIVVHLAPILLGDGVRLFAHPGSLRIDLERTSVAQTGQLTDLRFRVVK